jgi:hypothetical protein
VEITDLPAVTLVAYDTVHTIGLSPDAATAADAAIASIAEVDVQEWRDIDPAACVTGPAPCGSWEQNASEVPCVEPYLCLLVEGNGLFPGSATSSSSAAAVAIDPSTGLPASLVHALGTATTTQLAGFLTEEVARYQAKTFKLACDDPLSVAQDPLTPESITTWLPTAEGLKVWFEKYAVAPGVAGVVPMLVTWDELAHADDYVELGRTACAPTEVDGDGLPILAKDGNVTAAGILCPVGDLPDLTTGSVNVLHARVVQIVLQSYGQYAGALDGAYGTRTQKAVRQFQRNSGLTPDGLVGAKTWNALRSSYCRDWG